MLKKKRAIHVLIILVCTSSVFSQIKLNSLADFAEPHGDWFEAESVNLDADNIKQFVAKVGKGCFVNGSTGRTKHFETKEEFGDIELHIEFMVPKGSNSGIYFQNRYEIQIFDSWGVKDAVHSDCGGIYQRWDENKPKGEKGYQGVAPMVNACKAPGEWQTYDIIFRAPRFDKNGVKIKNAMFEKVVLNGIVIHKNREVSGATREGIDDAENTVGPLRIQGDHGRVALRNIRIRKLDAIKVSRYNKWVSLFEVNKSGSNFDFVVHGDATEQEANTMFEFKGKKLKAMYKWQEDSAPYGIAVSKKVYSSYDLKFKFKWGERRFIPRQEKIRDAGLLYHCQAGNYAWPPSLEYQIQEGDCGDLWNILGCHCDVIKNGELINIEKRDYSSSKKWEDHEKKGWNKVRIEVRLNSAKYFLNGVLINEITNATYGGQTLNSGFIALQAEYAEVMYKNIKIREIE